MISWAEIEAMHPGASAQWAAQGLERETASVQDVFVNALDTITVHTRLADGRHRLVVWHPGYEEWWREPPIESARARDVRRRR